MESKLVNYFLIGAQKAGTTTMYSWLSQHPKINAPESIKDFHFFTSKEYFPKGYEWFERFYKKKDLEIKINGAVNYIFRPNAPEIIKAYNPEAKFIVILRDPIKRAFSAYRFFEKLGREKLSFEEALEKERRGELAKWEEKDDYAYLEHGLYYQQLENWFSHFGRERFLILIYEELFQDPQVYLPEIFNFLDVNPDFKPVLETKNVSGEVKYKALNNLIYDDNSLLKRFINKTGVKHLVPLEWRGNFLNKFRDINTKKKGISKKLTEQQYKKLEPFFKEDSQNLSELLQKDLKGIWKF